MIDWNTTPCSAFEGSRCIATGILKAVALEAKAAVDAAAGSSMPQAVLIFCDATSEIVELDWRGSVAEFQTRVEQLILKLSHKPDETQAPNVPAVTEAGSPNAARGPGRPKLGVVAREVTLLPRHWEWLASQPGGASVVLRKLVELARRASEGKDRVRLAGAVGYKFMSTMAGHEVGFEEASRALFAGNQPDFEVQISNWPQDVQTHLKRILVDAFLAPTNEEP